MRLREKNMDHAAEFYSLLGLPADAVTDSMSTLAAVYRTISQRVPALKGGRISDNAVSLQFDVPDLENNAKTRLEQLYHLTSTNNGISTLSTGANNVNSVAVAMAPVVVDTKVVQHVSPSGRLVVRFIQNTAGDDRIVHLCRADDPLSIDAAIPLNKIHGPILDAPHFQNVDWNDDESCVVYCAEAQAVHTPPKLWGGEAKKKGTDAASSEKEDSRRSAFEAVQSFGEALKDFTSIQLFVVDFKKRTVKSIVPTDFVREHSAVSPTWLADSNANGGRVAFVSVPHLPTKLGLAHCCNRPATVCVVTVDDGTMRELQLPEGHQTLRNLRRRGKTIAALSPAPSTAHASGASLVVFDGTTAGDVLQLRVVVPIVSTPLVEGDEDARPFPGLYPAAGSDLFWADDNNLVVSSVVGSSVQLFRVSSLSSGTQLDQDKEHSPVTPIRYNAVSTSLLDCIGSTHAGTMNVLHNNGSRFLVSFSSATVPASVFYIEDILAEPDVHLVPIRRGTMQLPVLDLKTSLLKTVGTGRRVESLFHHHVSSTGSRPLVLFVHGGPHVTDTGSFLQGIYFYLVCGMNVLSVNYGGSLGFGQQQVDNLLGHAGDHDVADVVSALTLAQAQFHLSGPVIMSGGSHGGFLTAHLTSRFPHLFCAAIMRNPVIDMGAMWYATDIPDWCLAESGALDPFDVSRMLAASPSKHAGSMTVPTIIGIGLNDLRVPISQGRSWYYLVKARNPSVPIRLLEYPATGHSMDSPQAALDFAVHSVAFALSFVGKV